MKRKKLIKEVADELKLWERLDSFVQRNMKGKTFLGNIEGEIKYTIKERKTYLKNLKNEK